jgi:hypothetical protein
MVAKYQKRSDFKVRVKITYPVKTNLFFTDVWPVKIGDLVLEWGVQDGKIKFLTVSAPMSDADILPSYQDGGAPGVSATISQGEISRHNEIDQVLRTMQGLLSLYAATEIDFETVQMQWLPENAEEENRLTVSSFSRERVNPDFDRPRHFEFDLAARMALAAPHAKEFEIPLSFVRRGSRDFKEGRYIESFYNLFFFLETLFAPGFSTPSKVIKKFKAAKEIRSAISEVRRLQSSPAIQGLPKLVSLVGKTDDQLLEYLVETRGNLHHHAPRRSDVWRPDKPDEFRDDCLLLLQIVSKIALDMTRPILFQQKFSEELGRCAEEVGAILTFRVEAVSILDGKKQQLDPVTIRTIGRRVSRTAIDQVQATFRRSFPPHGPDFEIDRYQIMSDDRNHVYAIYQRHQS